MWPRPHTESTFGPLNLVRHQKLHGSGHNQRPEARLLDSQVGVRLIFASQPARLPLWEVMDEDSRACRPRIIYGLYRLNIGLYNTLYISLIRLITFKMKGTALGTWP